MLGFVSGFAIPINDSIYYCQNISNIAFFAYKDVAENAMIFEIFKLAMEYIDSFNYGLLQPCLVDRFADLINKRSVDWKRSAIKDQGKCGEYNKPIELHLILCRTV